jgi:hypothetical protein
MIFIQPKQKKVKKERNFSFIVFKKTRRKLNFEELSMLCRLE